MNMFRALLVVMGVAVLVYTIAAATNEGVILFATTLPSVGDFGW